MRELIERLDAATGPLDDGGVALLIAALNGKTLRSFYIATGDAGEDEMQIYCTDGATLRASSIYEYPDRSLDAAMSYVPEGRCLTMLQSEDGDFWGVSIRRAFSREENRRFYVDQDPILIAEAKRLYVNVPVAFTLPLALCIAVLKARAVNH